MPDLLARKEAVASKIVSIRQESSLLFFVALLLFLAASSAYGGLFLLTTAQASTRDELTVQIQEKENNLRPELIEQIYALENRLKNIGTLLNRHTFSSNAFRILEAATHPQVRFTNFGFNPESYKVEMSGETISYAVLARQVNILERDPQIERVEFGGLTLTGNNLLGFRVTIIFRSALLQIRPESVVATSTAP
ncbi:MAG: hypothetical protein HYT37_01765 [Candidatus Sungbacteria bacterium]|nr:hypothetical protein [Candidatus Sungbacteria bacterium]